MKREAFKENYDEMFKNTRVQSTKTTESLCLPL